MTQPILLCVHGVPLSRTCLCCGEPSPAWLALVAAGIYDAEGYRPSERKAAERRKAQR
jgi:hypothetical protein